MSEEVGSSPKSGLAKGSHAVIDGFKITRRFETNRPIEEHIKCFKTLEMKEDDVIICAFPKSGTHWLWEIVSMLISGNAEYEKRVKEFTMMEAVEIERTQSQPSPRILNTHVPTRLLPTEIKDKKVKMIHLYRNPKDVAISMYFHFKQTPSFADFDVEDSLREYVIDSGKGGYVGYLQDMAKFMEENPDHPVFNVSFEEMKEDTEGTVRRLGEFLGVKTKPELCADITRATSISNMREADKNKMQMGHLSSNINFYRKGVVGDWKNHMTVAQSEAVDAKMKELEVRAKFHFRYTV